MRISSLQEDRPARLEIVPLMDAIFLLLVFFVYATMSMIVHHGIRVELPAGASAAVDRADYVAVGITRDNRIFVNDRQVELAEVVPRVLVLLRDNPARAVYIRADEQSGFGTAFGVLDRLRLAGVMRLSFECKAREP